MSLKPAACNIITDSNCTSSGLHNLSTRSWGNIRGSVGLLLHQTINTNIYLFLWGSSHILKKKRKEICTGNCPNVARRVPPTANQTRHMSHQLTRKSQQTQEQFFFFFYNFYTSLKWHNNEKAINEFSAWMTSWQASKGMHNFEDTYRYLNNSIS